MNRRVFLAAVIAVLVAGCSGPQNTDTSNDAFAYYTSSHQTNVQYVLDTLGKQLADKLANEAATPLIVRDVKGGKPNETGYAMVTAKGDSKHAQAQVVLQYDHYKPVPGKAPVELYITTTAGVKYVLWGGTTFSAGNDPVVDSPESYSWSVGTAETTLDSASLTADNIDLNHPRRPDTTYKVLGYRAGKLATLTADEIKENDANFFAGLTNAVKGSGW